MHVIVDLTNITEEYPIDVQCDVGYDIEDVINESGTTGIWYIEVGTGRQRFTEDYSGEVVIPITVNAGQVLEHAELFSCELDPASSWDQCFADGEENGFIPTDAPGVCGAYGQPAVTYSDGEINSHLREIEE